MELNGNQIQLKNFNRRSVLHYIRRNIHATKAGLASVTGLTFMAIKKILEELVELNLIRDDQLEKGGMGRRAVTFTINENYGYTIGVYVNLFITTVAVMDLHGNILAKETYSMSEEIESQSAFVEILTTLIYKVLNRLDIPKDKVLGIGIGAPGLVDAENGIIVSTSNLQVLQYLPIKQILEEELGYQVLLDKDTNTLAAGEYWRGAGIGYSNVVYVDLDMSIGCGIVIDGKVNQGANGTAGEFGHLTIDMNGPLCACGNKGCLEVMSSGSAVLKEFSKQLNNHVKHPLYEKREQLEIQDIISASERNDLLAITILNKSALYAGVGISNLIHILDPQIIILGGILVQKCPRYLEIVKDAAYSRKLKGSRDTIMIVSSLNEEAGVIGAGELVASNFFNEIVNDVLSKN